MEKLKPQPVKELRDEIAIEVMKNLLNRNSKPIENRKSIAKQSYVMADAMLKASEKN